MEMQKSLWQAKLDQVKTLSDVRELLREWWPIGGELTPNLLSKLLQWLQSREELYDSDIRVMGALTASVSMVMDHPTPSMSDLRRALMTGLPLLLSAGDRNLEADIRAEILNEVFDLGVTVQHINHRGRTRFTMRVRDVE